MGRRPAVWPAAVLFVLASCSGDSSDNAEGAARNVGGAAGIAASGSPGVAPTAGTGAGAFAGAGGAAGAFDPVTGQPIDPNTGLPLEPPPLPPEQEVRLSFELPQASERFVYAANPEGGTVAIIDAETLAIRTLETGDRPTFLRTLAGTDDAIVLNVGSDDATVIRATASSVTTRNIDVVRGANAIAVSADGKHAVVYFDSSDVGAASGSGSFQDVTVLTLDPDGDEAVDMTVGFRPRGVFFAADSTQAYVVTEDGISILDFATIASSGPGIARNVSLGGGLDQRTLDVSVTPSGRYALARQSGESVVRLVDLQSGDIHSLDLVDVLDLEPLDPDVDGGTPEPPAVEVTDLDLAPDGSFALAVVRTQGTVLSIPLPGGFDDPSLIRKHAIEDATVGSVTITPDSARALLYTTAVNEERITLLDLEGDASPRTLALRKGVSAVAVAPDSKSAMIIHTKLDGDPNQPGLDPDVRIDRSHGYSVLNFATGAVKLQVTQAAPGSFNIVPDGSALFIVFRDDALGVREVQKVEMSSFLVRPIPLGSPPISVGSVAKSQRVFVSQAHADGRITFIDWVTNEDQTVTGFELNSRIRD